MQPASIASREAQRDTAEAHKKRTQLAKVVASLLCGLPPVSAGLCWPPVLCAALRRPSPARANGDGDGDGPAVLCVVWIWMGIVSILKQVYIRNYTISLRACSYLPATLGNQREGKKAKTRFFRPVHPWPPFEAQSTTLWRSFPRVLSCPPTPAHIPSAEQQPDRAISVATLPHFLLLLLQPSPCLPSIRVHEGKRKKKKVGHAAPHRSPSYTNCPCVATGAAAAGMEGVGRRRRKKNSCVMKVPPIKVT